MPFKNGNQYAKGNKPNKTSFKKGQIPWCKGLKGIHLSPKTEIKKGQHLSSKTEFKKGEMSNRQKGKNNSGWKGGISLKIKYCMDCGKKLGDYMSKRCKKCFGISKRDKNHPNWKGGVSQDKKYCNERSKIYRKNNKEKVTFWRRMKKMRKKSVGGSHTLNDWQNLKKQYNYTCPCCKKSEPEIKLTEDHIIPIIKGGSHNIENIQPLCHSCNSIKHTKIIYYER